MSPQAGEMLLSVVVPILQAAVPRSVRPVNAEDTEELLADTIASAAQMLDAAEQAGRPLMPASVAHYAVQRAKCGRRSTSASRTCVLSPAAALDRSAVVQSMDAAHRGCIDDDAGGLRLHEVLASCDEDPSQSAARTLDWAEFITHLDGRELEVVESIAAGGRARDLAHRFGVSDARVSQIRSQIGRRIHGLWGESALADAVAEPAWRWDVRAVREGDACCAERRLAAARQGRSS